VPQSLVDQFDEHAKKHGMTRSEAVTDAIREILQLNERRTGVSISSAEADPTDRV
jgi:metal-responsive CopG/Arc/MetJ family transcriptional regulator